MPIQTCPDCKQDRELVRINPKASGRCHICAEKHVMKFLPKVKYFRLCIDCGDIKKVRKNNAGIKRCRECNDKHRVEETAQKAAIIPPAPKPKPKPKPKPIKMVIKKVPGKRKHTRRPTSRACLDTVAIGKARLKNKEHKEFLEEEVKRKKEIPDQKLTDEDMIAAWYKKQEAS